MDAAVRLLQVREWQQKQQDQAKNQGYVCTLLGRQRQLPDASKKGPDTGAARGHALRAAINTPVQGSAADVATAAMISIDNCKRLKELGWKLLLQVCMAELRNFDAWNVCTYLLSGCRGDHVKH